MKLSRFRDISITSSKLPIANHLWFELDSGTIYLVDSTDQTRMYYSTNYGSSWTQLDLDPGDIHGGTTDQERAHKIQAGWHDRDNKIIYFVDCDNDGTADDFDVWKLDYSSSETSPTITEVGTSSGHDTNSVYAYDIWEMDSKRYVVCDEKISATDYVAIYEVTTGTFSRRDALAYEHETQSFGIIWGTNYYTFARSRASPDAIICLTFYGGTNNLYVESGAALGNYKIPDSRDRQGSAFNDKATLMYFIADKKMNGTYDPYLISFYPPGSAGTEWASLGYFNLIIMLDRNNAGDVPSTKEKAFGITNKCVYSITPRKAGIYRIQDLSNELSNNILAITDNYLMDTAGNIYQYLDITEGIFSCKYGDGIFPYESLGTLTVIPDYRGDFTEGDVLEIYDDDDDLGFIGRITNKGKSARDLTILRLDNLKNEWLRAVYTASYSSKKSSEILQDIVDNKFSQIWRSASITATTITYNYDLKKPVGHIFNYIRHLERQVIYCEPDLKMITKPYNSLVSSGLTWTDSDVTLIPIPQLDQFGNGYIEAILGITRASVRGAVNSNGEVYKIYIGDQSKEDLEGIIDFPLWEDPNIMNYTEANQLAQALYNIYSPSLKFVGLGKIYGKGVLTPGETVSYSSSYHGISSDTFMIAQFIYDAKHDNYETLVLVDGIIFPTEFQKYKDLLRDYTLQSSYYAGTTEATSDGSGGNDYTVTELMSNRAKDTGSSIIISIAGSEINGLTEKTSLVDNDIFLIEDSAASYVKKKVKASSFLLKEHTINIMPSHIVPQDGVTSGANNVYFGTGIMVFGTNSKTSSHYLRLFFELPDNYKDGSNVTLVVGHSLFNATGTDQVDYIVDFNRERDGTAKLDIESANSLFSSQDYSSGKIWKDTVSSSLASGNLIAGDTVMIELYLEDDSNNYYVFLHSIYLEITAEELD